MKKRTKINKDRNQLAFELDGIMKSFEDSFIIKLQTFFTKLTNKILKKADNLSIFKKSLDKTDKKDVIKLKNLFNKYYKDLGKESVKKVNDEIKILSGASSKIKVPDVNEGLRYRAEILALKKTKDFRDAIIQKINTSEVIKDKKDLIKTVKNASNLFANRNISVVARMESINAVNTARIDAGMKSTIVKGFQFLAILDKRTTDICKSRHLKVLKKDDPRVTGSFRPPCHWGCRSILSPVTVFEDMPFSDEAKLKVPDKNFGKTKDDSLDQTKIEKNNNVEPVIKPVEIKKDLVSIVKLRENEILKETKNKYELASVFDADGNIILNKTNYKKDEVNFTNSEIDKIKKSAVLTHNHPGSSSLSLPDVNFALAYKIKEVRAIAEDSYYGKIAFFIKNISSETIDTKKVVKLYNDYKGKIMNKNATLVDLGKLDSKYFSSKSSHETWVKVSKELGFDYGFEDI